MEGSAGPKVGFYVISAADSLDFLTDSCYMYIGDDDGSFCSPVWHFACLYHCCFADEPAEVSIGFKYVHLHKCFLFLARF